MGVESRSTSITRKKKKSTKVSPRLLGHSIFVERERKSGKRQQELWSHVAAGPRGEVIPFPTFTIYQPNSMLNFNLI